MPSHPNQVPMNKHLLIGEPLAITLQQPCYIPRNAILRHCTD
jgi:hypothetical protein